MSHARPNSSLTLRGSVVHYACVAGYQSTADELAHMDIVCDGQRWTSAAAHCTGKYSNHQLYLSANPGLHQSLMFTELNKHCYCTVSLHEECI